MLKQSDAVIIFVILAAVVGILIFSSNTASLVLVAALAAVFGGLIGTRLHKSRDEEAAVKAGKADSEAEQVPADDGAAKPAASAVAASEKAPVPEYSAGGHRTNGSMPAPAENITFKRTATGEPTTPSQVELLKNLVASVSEGITFKDAQALCFRQHCIRANAR